MAKLNPLRFFSSRKDSEFGLDQSVTGQTKFVLSDGTFNVKKISTHWWHHFNVYHWITNISWPVYFLAISCLYFVANIFFAIIYCLIGTEQIAGMTTTSGWDQWVQSFFFSAQTITTVGYGGMHPVGFLASTVSALEAFVGLMLFALATGTLYSRFSKPHTKLKYSEKILISPLEDKNALMFMLANVYHTSLMEVEATVNLSWEEKTSTGPKRHFTNLKLDVPKITLFATNWVVVHIIDQTSPLYALSQEDCFNESVQIFVLIKAYDDTFPKRFIHAKVISARIWSGEENLRNPITRIPNPKK